MRDAPDPLPTLTLAYEDLVRERDRLRDARRSVTGKLGPLPAASAIVMGLFGAFSDQVLRGTPKSLYTAALVLFVLIGALSSLAIMSKSYRKLRYERLSKHGLASDSGLEINWLAARIQTERELMEGLGARFDRERNFLLAVQWLFVLQIALLAYIPLASQ